MSQAEPGEVTTTPTVQPLPLEAVRVLADPALSRYLLALAFPVLVEQLLSMVVGVTEGYRKSLEISGTGYRVTAKGTDLEFALGFSHPVVVKAPAGITFTVERPTLFHVAGIDKQQVGEVAANIRKIRPPEPYKGKGVKYVGEVIRRKAGKAGKK